MKIDPLPISDACSYVTGFPPFLCALFYSMTEFKCQAVKHCMLPKEANSFTHASISKHIGVTSFTGKEGSICQTANFRVKMIPKYFPRKLSNFTFPFMKFHSI